MLTVYEQSIVLHGTEVFDTGGSHNVWILAMKDGSSFVIDVAGAQFGHHDILYSANRYEMLYSPRYQHSIGWDLVRNEYSSQLSGGLGALLLGDSGQAMAKRHLMSAQIIDETASNWANEKKLSLTRLLDLPEQEQYDKTTDLVERIKKNLSEHWKTERGKVETGIGNLLRSYL